MSQTRQIVSWSLEHLCPYRRTEESCKDADNEELFWLRLLGDALEEGDVFEGICLVDFLQILDDAGSPHSIPLHGFKLTDLQQQHRVEPCRKCVANLGGELVAGCTGRLPVRLPYSLELEEELWSRIRSLNLEPDLRAHFQITSPLWYGLWISSPLSVEQRSLLLSLFEDEQAPEFAHFRDGLRLTDIPIHVDLAPPGHASFGFYQDLPHCPRCKASPAIHRAETGDACCVCGHQSQMRARPDSEREIPPPTTLTQLLGDEEQAFVHRWLLSRGTAEETAAKLAFNQRF